MKDKKNYTIKQEEWLKNYWFFFLENLRKKRNSQNLDNLNEKKE
jgi:hypothetical protein